MSLTSLTGSFQMSDQGWRLMTEDKRKSVSLRLEQQGRNQSVFHSVDRHLRTGSWLLPCFSTVQIPTSQALVRWGGRQGDLWKRALSSYWPLRSDLGQRSTLWPLTWPVFQWLGWFLEAPSAKTVARVEEPAVTHDRMWQVDVLMSPHIYLKFPLEPG